MSDWIALPQGPLAGRSGLTEFVTPDFGHLYVPATILHRGRTAFQEIEILETPTFGRVLFLDGKIQLSYLDEERYHQYLVQGPLLCHPQPRSILIIGGGDGGAIEEACKHSGLTRIVMAELDREVVAKSRELLPQISRGAFDDARVELRFSDALADLKQRSDRYDVIIVDLTEPHGPSKMLYTQEFYHLLTTRLTRGGLIGIHTDNYWLFPESYSTIFQTLRAVFGDHLATAQVGMPCFGMDWSFRIASPEPIDLDRLARNFETAVAAGMRLDAFEPSVYRVQPTAQERGILKTYGRVSTDAQPFDKFAHGPSFITGRIAASGAAAGSADPSTSAQPPTA